MKKFLCVVALFLLVSGIDAKTLNGKYCSEDGKSSFNFKSDGTVVVDAIFYGSGIKGTANYYSNDGKNIYIIFPGDNDGWSGTIDGQGVILEILDVKYSTRNCR